MLTTKQLRTAYQDYKIYVEDTTRATYGMPMRRGVTMPWLLIAPYVPSPVAGRKKQKKRLTLLVCANSSGTEKFPLFFIGSARRPGCFQKKTGEQLGFDYAYNKKAWMTMDLFLSGCFALIRT